MPARRWSFRRRPALGTDQRNEAHVGDLLGPVLGLGQPRDTDELLHPHVGAERHHQPAADAELALQRLGHLGAGRGDRDGVVGCMVGPSPGPVSMENVDVRYAEISKRRRGLLGELADPLDRVHVAGDAREHRGRVSRAGSDLEHLLTALEREGVRHQRDDVRLRDRLAGSDGQRRVLVGELGERRRQELLARDGAHGGENELRADAARGDGTVDHRLAPAREVGAAHVTSPRSL